jgi:hypothetical protein
VHGSEGRRYLRHWSVSDLIVPILRTNQPRDTTFKGMCCFPTISI